MPYPGLTTDRLELVAVIHADLHSGTYYTPWISMAQRERLLFVLDVGDMTATSTVDLELHEAQDAAGTGAVAIAGKAITQLTQAGGDGNDDVCINLGAAELNAAQNFDHVRARLDVLTASSNACLFVFAEALRYLPPAVTAWTEIVA